MLRRNFVGTIVGFLRGQASTKPVRMTGGLRAMIQTNVTLHVATEAAVKALMDKCFSNLDPSKLLWFNRQTGEFEKAV